MSNVGVPQENRMDVGKPPCTNCRHLPWCSKRDEVCKAFIAYTGGHKLEPPDEAPEFFYVPSADLYNKLYATEE